MRTLPVIVLVGVLASASLLAACAAHKGPAQKAGRAIDRAVGN